jgi:dihydropteroate synthase
LSKKILNANIVKTQDTTAFKKKLLNCRGKLLSLNHPLVMGILNVTPDSFYDGGSFTTEKEWLSHTEKMLSEGADIIDIGCTSTRPGAKVPGKEEEITKLSGVLNSVVNHFPDAVISVDTYHASVAEKAVDCGAAIINDISGGTMDTEMFAIIARLKVPYILMHIQGVPETMHIKPTYNNVVKETVKFFSEKISELYSMGLNDIIIDPGFGFGKNIEHNFTLLKNLNVFKYFNNPLLVGVSRKSMIWKTLQITPSESLNGTTILNTIALMGKADILRVHDVKEAKETIRLLGI